MSYSIHQKVLLLFTAILIIIGLTGYAVYESNQKMHDSSRWIDHTEQVINVSEKIRSLTIDIETSSRGYVITKDIDFLEPIINAKKVIFVNLNQLKTLTNDNVHQSHRIDSLEFYIEKRMAFSLSTIALRNNAGLSAAITKIATKQGKKYTDQIRQLVTAIQKEEYDLLEQRKQINEKQVTIFNWISVAMFLLIMVSATLLLFSFYRNLLQIKEKQIKANELVIINNELKIAENNYLKLNEVLEQLVIERTAKLETANKELESFSYSVSHDLRAPIRAINGYTKILEEDYSEILDQDGQIILASILTNSKKMGNLIDDLLAFSKLGRKPITGSEINMQEMVNTVCIELTKEDSGKQIEFAIHPLPKIDGDPSLIKQVWINLISNAIKYSKYKPNTLIEIGSYPNNKQTVYYIKDNGAGFDMKYYNKLFGVFQRLHGQDEFEGTGIGLAIVQKIINKHNGIVWGESIINDGASFYFSLPNEKMIVPEITN